MAKDTQTLFAAITARNAYLEEHPELKEFQQEYEAWMAKATEANRFLYFKMFWHEYLVKTHQRLVECLPVKVY